MGRADYIRDKHRLYGRYFYAKLNRAAVSGKENLVIANRLSSCFPMIASDRSALSVFS